MAKQRRTRQRPNVYVGDPGPTHALHTHNPPHPHTIDTILNFTPSQSKSTNVTTITDRLDDDEPLTVTTTIPTTPTEQYLQELANSRRMFSTLLEAGVPLQILLGVDHCYEHNDYLPMHDRPLPSSCNFFEDTIYCNNCGQWMRRRVPLSKVYK